MQVSYLGYPNTTGMESMGYRLTDEWADPVGASERLHTEKLERLSGGMLCFRPDPDAPVVSPLPAYSNGYITFGSFNNLAKVSLAAMRVWARILQELPKSKLLLKSRSLGDEPTRALVRQRMGKEGVPVERVEMIGMERDHLAHLAMYRRVDVALDPFPYNGATTTCEALWMGVPVVTLAGSVHAGRVGVSILTSAGLAEMVAKDEEQYVTIALTLARDVERLGELRLGMREKLAASALFDERRLAREVDRVYRNMWKGWCG